MTENAPQQKENPVSYVIQRPRSNTNPTDKFLVVPFAEWNAYINGMQLSAPRPIGSFDEEADAEKLRDQLNTEARTEG